MKSKTLKERKIEAAEAYLTKNVTLRQLAEKYNVSYETIRHWVLAYEVGGLQNYSANGHTYPRELKLNAIKEYNEGNDSITDICSKYGIYSTKTLSRWLKKYRDGEEIRSSWSHGTWARNKTQSN